MIDDLRRSAAEGAQVVRAAVAAGELPGAAFGVATVEHGIVLQEAFGRRSVGGSEAVTVSTPFSLASTTKPIATTVLGRLVEQGSIDLDERIDRLVPELPPPLVPGPAVTVRAVASHTAGLGTHHRFFYADERPPVPPAEAVRELARPVLPVGGQWRYSNLGYGLLQMAMERAAGTDMASLVERVVFEPAGMRTAGWGGLDGPIGASARHLSTTDLYPGYVTDHPAASEAWASIDDLLRFGLAHAGSTLLSPATHDLLAAPAAPRQPDGAAYALGWVTREYDGVRLLVHGGRMGGVGAHLAVVPALGLVVAGVASIETERLAEAVGRVLAAMVPGYHAPVPVDPWAVGKAHPLLARRWEGTAHFGLDELPVVLDGSGDRITVDIAGVSAELVMPHVQPDAVLGHVLASPPHPLAAPGSICHLDAVPGTVSPSGFTPLAGSADPDTIIGALVVARYTNPDHPRQGDAVSAALHLKT